MNITSSSNNTIAIGTHSAEKPMEPMNIQRRDLQEHDIEIEILYCGICHSDLHAVKNEWEKKLFRFQYWRNSRNPGST